MQTVKVLTRASYYALKSYRIQDCEECEERARSVPKHTNVRYCTLRTMTENQKILLAQLFGHGHEQQRCRLKLGSNNTNEKERPGFENFTRRSRY